MAAAEDTRTHQDELGVAREGAPSVAVQNKTHAPRLRRPTMARIRERWWGDDHPGHRGRDGAGDGCGEPAPRIGRPDAGPWRPGAAGPAAKWAQRGQVRRRGPVVGEGYEVQAEIADAVHKSYGAVRSQYAHPLVGGINYPAGIHQPALPHVTNLGADGLFIEGASAPAADGFTVLSAPSRPSLLSRLLGRFRRPR
jgi:hypothetical protein